MTYLLDFSSDFEIGFLLKRQKVSEEIFFKTFSSEKNAGRNFSRDIFSMKSLRLESIVLFENHNLVKILN